MRARVDAHACALAGWRTCGCACVRTRNIICMDYYYIIMYAGGALYVYVCAMVGLLVCIRVYVRIMRTCVRPHVCTGVRARVRERMFPCERQYVHVRACAHAGARTSPTCVRA